MSRLVIAMLSVASTACAQTPPLEAERPGSHVWLDIPWNLRYVVDFRPADEFDRAQARASRRNATAGTDVFRWEEFFNGRRMKTTSDPTFPVDEWMLTVISFDPSGRVTSPHKHPGPLTGRINRLRYVTLASGDGPRDRVFDLGEWFTGLGDASTDWAPAVCASNDMPDPPGMASNTGYRYGPRFSHPELSGTFGCREWAYQLYDRQHPYIDVTSYVPKRGGAPTAFIRSFIGFARFGDVKPVIGQQRGDWYCLLDCPDGEAPGRIADMSAWAAKRGWLSPTPPTRSPTFPDPPAPAGTYSR